MIIINVDIVISFLLLFISIIYSLTFNNIYLFNLHNIINIILYKILLYYCCNIQIKLYTLNLFIPILYFFDNKFLFMKLLLSAYFFTFLYNYQKNNKYINLLKYFIYIFLFEDNKHKFFFNDHFIILYILNIINQQIPIIYSLYYIITNLPYFTTPIFTIFIHSFIFNKNEYSFFTIFINNFLILFFIYLQNYI
jgi:hypothetical protein